MMLQQEFFKTIEAYHTSQRPFVVYRKPDSIEVSAILQNDNQTHYVSDFKERGFVFAPFDSSKKAIIFPLTESKKIHSIVNTKCNIQQSEFEPEHSEAEKQHIALVKKGIEFITKNELSKVVLSRSERINHSEENPLEIFKKLLSLYTNAFVYCWYHPKIGMWLGATPETLIYLKGNRFKTMSLAGTQDYIPNAEITWQQKELTEQQFVTDHIKASLEPLSQQVLVGNVKSAKAGHLLHLKSEISGLLKSDLKLVLQNLHPTPAVCGLPVDKSKAFILKHENYDREFYTGFLGELNFVERQSRNTNRRNVENNAYASVTALSHLFVNLRCMQWFNKEAIIYIGGGITSDSNPENEWQETVSKAKVIKQILER